jgi:hypothetical protein
MIGQILPNNSKKCYRNFSPKFFDLNTPLFLRSSHFPCSAASPLSLLIPTLSLLSCLWWISHLEISSSVNDSCGEGQCRSERRPELGPIHADEETELYIGSHMPPRFIRCCSASSTEWGRHGVFLGEGPAISMNFCDLCGLQAVATFYTRDKNPRPFSYSIHSFSRFLLAFSFSALCMLIFFAWSEDRDYYLWIYVHGFGCTRGHHIKQQSNGLQQIWFD